MSTTAAGEAERDKVCWCTHSGHDHDAGECWAEVDSPKGRGQCACNWWEPGHRPHHGGGAALLSER